MVSSKKECSHKMSHFKWTSGCRLACIILKWHSLDRENAQPISLKQTTKFDQLQVLSSSTAILRLIFSLKVQQQICKLPLLDILPPSIPANRVRPLLDAKRLAPQMAKHSIPLRAISATLPLCWSIIYIEVKYQRIAITVKFRKTFHLQPLSQRNGSSLSLIPNSSFWSREQKHTRLL